MLHTAEHRIKIQNKKKYIYLYRRTRNMRSILLLSINSLVQSSWISAQLISAREQNTYITRLIDQS